MSNERRKKLVGAVGALRTFRTDDGELDLDKQEFHLNWVIEQGLTEGNACIMLAAGGSEGYFMSDEEWEAYLFLRSNPRGTHFERWIHIHGCARYFNAVRDTVSDKFILTYAAGQPRPTAQEIEDAGK